MFEEGTRETFMLTQTWWHKFLESDSFPSCTLFLYMQSSLQDYLLETECHTNLSDGTLTRVFGLCGRIQSGRTLLLQAAGQNTPVRKRVQVDLYHFFLARNAAKMS